MFAVSRLHKKRNDHLLNTRVQVVLKQGQVEALTPDLTAGSVDADFLLCHRSRVDGLREEIRVGLDKHTLLSDFQKKIPLRWISFWKKPIQYTKSDWVFSFQNLVEEKIAVIEKSKGIHRKISQMEWKLKVLRNQIQDLKDKERNIKMLRLSEQQQDMKVIQFFNVRIISQKLHL